MLGLEDLRNLLSKYKFSFTNEKELQEGIAQVLKSNYIYFNREISLSKKDRIDFLLENGIGLEVKIDGSATKLANQIRRYLDHEQLTGILIVVNLSKLLDLPVSLNGKPIITLCLRNL